LAELRRVLKPGGRFHFLEHGLAPEPKVQRRQQRIEPMQRRHADGCHLTRDAVGMVTAAGFVVERSESRYTRGPKPWSYMTEGFAVSP
jgi:ubiquinone/menaquinone biosynthesis C-methylase UbiE